MGKDKSSEQKSTCFIIMPITTPDSMLETYKDGEEHFKHVLEYLFIPAVEQAGVNAIPPIAKGTPLIQAEIIHHIDTTDLVLCDMSALNPNVFFELGTRTALNKPICMVVDDVTDSVPFDMNMINYHKYSSDLCPWTIKQQVDKLAEHIRDTVNKGDGKNPLWKYFGLKSEASAPPPSGEEQKLDYIIRILETGSSATIASALKDSQIKDAITFRYESQIFEDMAMDIARQMNVDLRDIRWNHATRRMDPILGGNPHPDTVSTFGRVLERKCPSPYRLGHIEVMGSR